MGRPKGSKNKPKQTEQANKTEQIGQTEQIDKTEENQNGNK